ncbi:MAG: hypothetical protein KGJ88_11705 [Verrucomicrobiota bacterium]|nr:hypothetical protein [Verrucomicrobiota bacterium]
MKNNKHVQDNQSAPSLFAPLAIGFAIGVLACGTAFLIWNHDSPSHSDAIPTYRVSGVTTPPSAAPVMTDTMAGMPGMPGMAGMTTTTTPASDPAVLRVAARFDCLCADHCDKSVDVCTCATAQAERAFIQTQLHAGHTEAEAVKALNQKYGGLKSQS